MTMINKSQYEKRILSEIRSLPEESLPKIARLLSLIREEFVTPESKFPLCEEDISHEKTRNLLLTSKGNWAADVIREIGQRMLSRTGKTGYESHLFL
jgi:hypothetical protein